MGGQLDWFVKEYLKNIQKQKNGDIKKVAVEAVYPCLT